MADVDDLSVGNDIQNDAFNGPDEMIVESEVGGKRNDGPVRQFVPRARAELCLECRK